MRTGPGIPGAAHRRPGHFASSVLVGPPAMPRRRPRQRGHERRDPGGVAVRWATPHAGLGRVEQVQAGQALVDVVQVRRVVDRRRGRHVRRRQVRGRRVLGHVRRRQVGGRQVRGRGGGSCGGGGRAGGAPEQTLAAPSAPVGEVLGVRHGHLLALVPHQLDGPPDLRGHGALEAALAQKGVDRLDAVPSWKKKTRHKCYECELSCKKLDILVQSAPRLQLFAPALLIRVALGPVRDARC